MSGDIGFKNRWRIEGTLTTASWLHIGSGYTTTRDGISDEKKNKKADIAAIATDHAGRPYLPGATLKGNLRAYLLQVESDKQKIKKLFGAEGPDCCGGALEFWNARVVIPSDFDDNVPYWDNNRLTGVTASIAIDRQTRTAVHQKLFYAEYVPPGVSFEVVITGQDIKDDEVSLLIAALNGFTEKRVRLGAGSTDGWGEFEWKLRKIRFIDSTSVKEWIRNPSAVGYDMLPESFEKKKNLTACAIVGTQDKKIPLEIKIKLTFKGPFLVNDPSRTDKDKKSRKTGEGGEKPTDHCPLLDINGKPLLPAKSVRGAFRNQAEKILRTIGGSTAACYDHPHSERKACEPVHSQDDVKKLCPACRVFGASGWRSLVRFSDFTCVDKGEVKNQQFVAIDRFMGSGAEGAKFDALYADRPAFSGTMSVDIYRLNTAEIGEWGLGLIALTLHDLVEGDIAFGLGASKGYGACEAEITSGKDELERKLNDIGGWYEKLKSNSNISDGDAVSVKNKDMLSKKKFLSFSDLRAVLLNKPDKISVPAPSSHTMPPEERPSKKATDKKNGDVEGTSTWPEFYNPYHFVPAKDKGSIDDLSKEDFTKRRLGHVTHDRYAENTHSGRVICRLSAETPFFVGHERTKDGRDDSPAEVAPFKIDGKPGIPASSLRGLVSNIAEAASNSALRILEKRNYSYRMEMRKSLGSIGMIVEEKGMDGTARRRLRPLALPSLRWQSGCAGLPPELGGIFTKPLLKVYLNGYREDPSQIGVVQHITGTFLDRQRPESYSADRQQYWYVRLKGTTGISGNRIDCTDPHLKRIITRDGRVSEYINGQKIEGDPINQTVFDSLPDGEKKKYTRGIIRVLGIENRENQIPTSKTHEIFIPYPDWMEKEPIFDCENAARLFEFLAAERTNETTELPFHVKGSRRNDLTKDDDKSETYNIRLRHGDIVFFRPDEKDRSRVAEVSISSIWRRSAGGTSHDYFRAISPELLPFNPERSAITIAEQMFGFVEQDIFGCGPMPGDSQAKALASRLRFSNAEFASWKEGKENGNYFLPHVTLKILDRPKPPSPALYFKHSKGKDDYIEKKDLIPGKYHPQGRKVYLHHNLNLPGNKEPWKTFLEDPDDKRARLKQKVRITPVKGGAVFYFHIDFDNLSGTELGLLLFSLEPSENFRHKLGMGKPIGLGTVGIEPVGLFTIERKKKRYSTQAKTFFSAVRYHNSWVRDNNISSWPAAYDREKKEYGSRALDTLNYEALKEGFSGRMDADIKKALEEFGDASKTKLPVHYPQMCNLHIENENFEWFMNNDNIKNRNKQFLTPSKLTKLR